MNVADVIGENNLSDKLHTARSILRNNVRKIILKIEDIDDWISFIFLVLDEEILPYEGFKLTNEVLRHNFEFVATFIAMRLMKYQPGSIDSIFDPIIESLFYIGCHNILEDDLQLCFTHNLEIICKNLNSFSPDHLDLYKVFAEIPQEEADRIITDRLCDWVQHQPGETFERAFLKNLTQNNYLQLLTDVYNALEMENNSLARVLRPYALGMDQHMSPLDMPLVSLYPDLQSGNYYPLPTREPHGLCVIINVKKFHPPTGTHDELALDQRLGSDVDKLRLEGTFKLFGFEIYKVDDPTKAELENLFLKLRTSATLWAMKCLAVCVMTHGDIKDRIYMADREPISVVDLRRLCYSRAMIGKPKLYIVQACRGEGRLRPVLLQCDNTTVSSNSETDCLIAASTVRGYSSIRSMSSGTWFITDFCASLQEYGHREPLKTVLRKTKVKLNERVENFEGKYVTQAPEDIDTLTKEIQFVRAKESTFLEGILDLCLLEIQEEIVDILIGEAANDSEFASSQVFL